MSYHIHLFFIPADFSDIHFPCQVPRCSSNTYAMIFFISDAKC